MARLWRGGNGMVRGQKRRPRLRCVESWTRAAEAIARAPAVPPLDVRVGAEQRLFGEFRRQAAERLRYQHSKESALDTILFALRKDIIGFAEIIS